MLFFGKKNYLYKIDAETDAEGNLLVKDGALAVTNVTGLERLKKVAIGVCAFCAGLVAASLGSKKETEYTESAPTYEDYNS